MASSELTSHKIAKFEKISQAEDLKVVILLENSNTFCQNGQNVVVHLRRSGLACKMHLWEIKLKTL